MVKMTPEQMQAFIEAAQVGMACGLEHPIEWYVNVTSGMWISAMPYDNVPAYIERMLDAFVAFYRGTASCPEDPVENLTREGFIEMVNRYYNRSVPNGDNSPSATEAG